MNLITKINKDDFQQWRDKCVEEGGLALVYKEKEWTSFDVVAKMRGITRIKKVGHSGTLDPLATGLLVICLGKATKLADTIQAMQKTYRAQIKLGATTITDDSEADEENLKDVSNLTKQQILETIKTYIGKIDQIPPMYSAKKVQGKRLYQLARKNIEIELKPSQVEVYNIYNIEISLPFVNCDIDCSKGTYIRSLARDIGAKLGCGGYLSALERTKIGDFRSDNALLVSEYSELRRIADLNSQIQ